MNSEVISTLANYIVPIASVLLVLGAFIYAITKNWELPGLDIWLVQNGIPMEVKKKAKMGVKFNSTSKMGVIYEHSFQHIRKQKGRYSTETYWQCKTKAQMPYLVSGGSIYVTSGVCRPGFGLFGKYRNLTKTKLNKQDFDANFKLYVSDESIIHNQKIQNALDILVDINGMNLYLSNQELQIVWKLQPKEGELNIFNSKETLTRSIDQVSKNNIQKLDKCLELMDLLSRVH
jgi:hypothetical protein